MRRLGNHPLLPVVNRADLQRLDGVVTLRSVLEAYQVAYRTSATAGGEDIEDK